MHLVDARIHAPAPGQPMSAGYFMLMNHGSKAVTLTGFISDTVAVQMHTTKVENNGTTMRPLNSITIAADDQIIGISPVETHCDMTFSNRRGSDVLSYCSIGAQIQCSDICF